MAVAHEQQFTPALKYNGTVVHAARATFTQLTFTQLCHNHAYAVPLWFLTCKNASIFVVMTGTQNR